MERRAAKMSQANSYAKEGSEKTKRSRMKSRRRGREREKGGCAVECRDFATRSDKTFAVGDRRNRGMHLSRWKRKSSAVSSPPLHARSLFRSHPLALLCHLLFLFPPRFIHLPLPFALETLTNFFFLHSVPYRSEIRSFVSSSSSCLYFFLYFVFFGQSFAAPCFSSPPYVTLYFSDLSPFLSAVFSFSLFGCMYMP